LGWQRGQRDNNGTMCPDSPEVKTGSLEREGLATMYAYYVTFRIADKTVGGKTYDDRRQQLIDNVYTESGYWEETTSFLLANSTLDTNAFAAKAATGLSASDDLLVVIDPSDKSASYFGPLKHIDVLRSFFPKLKKVP
jgi:hypothetical protein